MPPLIHHYLFYAKVYFNHFRSTCVTSRRYTRERARRHVPVLIPRNEKLVFTQKVKIKVGPCRKV